MAYSWGGKAGGLRELAPEPLCDTMTGSRGVAHVPLGHKASALGISWQGGLWQAGTRLHHTILFQPCYEI